MFPYPFLEAAYMAKMCGGGVNIQPLTVTENKEYNSADYGCDGFQPVLVNVPSGGGSDPRIEAIENAKTILSTDITDGWSMDVKLVEVNHYDLVLAMNSTVEQPYISQRNCTTHAFYLVVYHNGEFCFARSESASGAGSVASILNDFFSVNNGNVYLSKKIEWGVIDEAGTFTQGEVIVKPSSYFFIVGFRSADVYLDVNYVEKTTYYNADGSIIGESLSSQKYNSFNYSPFNGNDICLCNGDISTYSSYLLGLSKACADYANGV